MICIISNCHNKKNQYSNVTPINTSQEAISADTSSKIDFSKSADSNLFGYENYNAISITSIDTSLESISVDTSFKHDFSKSTDSIVFDDENYKIIIIPHIVDVGDLIGVYNKFKKKSLSIDEGDSYYVAVVDSFIIIDSGTSNYRGLSIYNLNSAKKVFSGRYVGDLVRYNKSIKFLAPVEITDSTKLPKCPDEWKDYVNSIGYVEVLIINLKDLKLIETGQYECWFFE
jgi:hypothetical protein